MTGKTDDFALTRAMLMVELDDQASGVGGKLPSIAMIAETSTLPRNTSGWPSP